MAAKQVVPALGLESFSCPYPDCGALAHQTWFRSFAKDCDKDNRPWLPTMEQVKRLKAQQDDPEGPNRPLGEVGFERGVLRSAPTMDECRH
jgi:hypothetical protein